MGKMGFVFLFIQCLEENKKGNYELTHCGLVEGKSVGFFD
jgi:hypothetical protein